MTSEPGAPGLPPVTRQVELHLLAEPSDLLESEYGPVPEEYVAGAQAAWPDNQ